MKNLLTAVDFSKTTEPVLEQASILAKSLDATLWIIHVSSDETRALAYEASPFTGYAPEFSTLPSDVQVARDLSAEEIKREHRELLGMSAALREKGIDAKALLLKGDPASLIIEKAAELDAAMIILGSHGHGLLHKAFLGSVSESVMRRAPCNILIVPAAGS